MKSWQIRTILAVALGTGALTGRAGVIFTNLHSLSGFTNGANPIAGLMLGSGGNFYGTTQVGGTNGEGTVFAVSASGALTSLYSFTGGNDGANPDAGLAQGNDGELYGTTYLGGTNGYGTVFRISTNGALTSLYSFTNGSDGANPFAVLTLGSDGNFYGTTQAGGTNGNGTIFKISASGAFTSLHSFTRGNDGASPQAGLVEGSDSSFYGTTQLGGTNGDGTVFKISASGAFTSLYSFTNGSDGYYPDGSLVQGRDGEFYGTTYGGGLFGNGAVFKITAGGVFTSLYSFTGGDDGGSPQAGLVQGSDGNFYGTTYYDGTNGCGTAFQITVNGEFTSLYSFTNGSDGRFPSAGLVQGSDGNFYGTATGGGTNGSGTVFNISAGGTLTSLFSFSRANDGANPQAALVQGSDGSFYGTAYGGGTNNFGTVFKISASGEFTTLYSFTNGSDGANPVGGLVQGSDGDFYGMAYDGGTNNVGTVYKISASGTLTSLYTFTNGEDGSNPNDGLVQTSDGGFYGTASDGGTNGEGTVFEVSASGTFNRLYSFSGGDDGASPNAQLVQGNDGEFYGTAIAGGSNYDGTVFKISADGVLTSLYSFTGGDDGANPEAGLAEGSDGWFYGTTGGGGTNNLGTVFKISPSGSFISLYSFANDGDGAYPGGALTQGSDGNFYGTTFGGSLNHGSVFEITPAGVLTTLYLFTGDNDGSQPEAGLTQGSDGSFYGTTTYGGAGGNGAVFRISVGIGPVIPVIQTSADFGVQNQRFGFNILGAGNAAVIVQATTNLGNPAWIAVSTNTLVGGVSRFSDPLGMSFPQRFYRVCMP